ncbi:MAG: hypothetical protein N4Q30_02445, partial [Neisseriaceae bacterium]|nr:hypothetical protein [Neisseriaceae bacterium]
ESINELEVNTRAQFILADKDGDFMLIGFMAPSLNQIQNPLKESTYSRLLNQLFKQLNLTFPDDYLIKKQELNQYISKYKIQAILLFSREFNATQLLTELSQKNAPIKILEHPNNLIRNPLLKKELWLQLHQFFKNLN